MLKGVDAVAVCIGNHNTHLYINSICLELGIPAIYAYVGADASAGRVIRVTEEKGCYNCVYEYMTLYKEKFYDLPSIEDVNALPTDYGCNTPATPGTSFDFKTIALAQARLVVQTLLRGSDSYPDEKMNLFLLTNRKIENIPDSNALWCKAWNIPKWEHCPFCGTLPKVVLTGEQMKKYSDLIN